jgi:diaminohydroxyphosphoribosylaminopyrimidine deaminase/5-amino-6-(5-phosphoribosylamino)uracil reductase
MEHALALAGRGLGSAAPNPVVGAVVVSNGEVVGEGFHRAAGEPHAEVLALAQAGERARGATLYLTLEPCTHFGRTPPCAPAVIAAGIAKVVVACADPDPRVAGGGLRSLAEAGLEVVRADEDLRERCALQNQFFLASVVNGRPFVTLKYAMSLDGKIACASGHSQWISGPQSRAIVHEERALHQAVMVGIGTALADDPLLTVRDLPGARQPVRIVVDSLARLPANARILNSAGGPVWVAVGPRAPAARIATLRARGARVEVLPEGLDLGVLMKRLLSEGIRSVLAEGGGELAASLLRAKLLTRLLVFVAPMLIGGRGAPSPVGGLGVETLSDAPRLIRLQSRVSGADLAIEGYVDLRWLTI